MPNPSPFGAFAEGIAGGINQATSVMFQAYMKKSMADIDREDKMAKLRFTTGIELYKIHKGNPTKQKEILTKILAPSLGQFNGRGGLSFTKKDQEQFLSAFDPGTPASEQLFKEMERIAKAEAKGDITGETALDSMQSAMMGYTGTLTDIQKSGVTSKIKGFETQVEREGVAGLFTDPTKQAAAMAGVGYKDIVQKPKTPTPSMYELQDVGDSKVQKMKWNPKTKTHDIPFGKPYKKKVEPKEGWQRKTRTYVDSGKLWKQDYDYNPKTAKEKKVGEPYLSRDLGSALEAWLLGNDPLDKFK